MTYILKDPNADGETLIFLTYHFNGKKVKISTGEKIRTSDWNPNTCRPRKSFIRFDNLNRFLDRLENKIREVHLDLKGEFQEISPFILKQAVQRDILTNGKRETFMEFFDRFIRESRTHRKEGSMEVYSSVYKLLRGYAGAKDFEDINSNWFVNYQSYLERNGYSVNYIGKNVGVIREIITIARNLGLTRNTAYRNGYKKPHEEVESIYLTVNELLHIYGIELPDYLDRARNRFLIGAFTGLRFSDSAKITPESIREGLIFDKNVKTGDNVVIPIHWVVRQIMEFHQDGLPPSLSNQKTNEYLKVIGEKAGITTPIIIRKTIGGKVISRTYKKFELITSHTARRSAITNMLLMGVPTQAIMRVSGHKTESSFQKYVKMSKEESARNIQHHPFFQ